MTGLVGLPEPGSESLGLRHGFISIFQKSRALYLHLSVVLEIKPPPVGLVSLWEIPLHDLARVSRSVPIVFMVL